MSRTQTHILRGRPDLEAILEYLSINGPSSARAMKAAGLDCRPSKCVLSYDEANWEEES